MKEPEKIGKLLPGVIAGYKNYDLWRGTRGPKPKYNFQHLKRGEIEKINCNAKKARAIQTAIIAAARRDGPKIKTENHGNFILVKRSR